MSYDPVKTKIDSAFYGPLTDRVCIDAAIKLIELQQDYSSAKSSYEDALENIKFFHSANVGIPSYGKRRDTALKDMKELQQKIEEKKKEIKYRDNSFDGKFIGWQLIHKYRASNKEGVVSFGNVLYIVDPRFTEYHFRFSLDDRDKYTFNKIKEIIDRELNIDSDSF